MTEDPNDWVPMRVWCGCTYLHPNEMVTLYRSGMIVYALKETLESPLPGGLALTRGSLNVYGPISQIHRNYLIPV